MLEQRVVLSDHISVPSAYSRFLNLRLLNVPITPEPSAQLANILVIS